jgi:hypothetical protein
MHLTFRDLFNYNKCLVLVQNCRISATGKGVRSSPEDVSGQNEKQARLCLQYFRFVPLSVG